MKEIILLILLNVCSVIFAKTNKIHLVSNNKSDYRIIVSSSASGWDSSAASELQQYIQEISDVKIPITNDLSPVLPKEIIIGKNKHSESLDLTPIHSNDGFIIKTIGNKLYFAGGAGKGTLYSVYTFLQKYLNCRMYSSTVKVIPKEASIIIPQINDVENPVFSYRTINSYESKNDVYAQWHMLADSKDKKMWGMFVHTFQKLLPPDKYFKKHPEYFALRGNIRVPEQPCLSNSAVFKIMLKELRKRMKENPGAKIWSVSQNDNYSYCEGPACSKIDSIEGSPSGSIINFVNKIAKRFPDKIISTLAYQYSRKAPKHIKPVKNVNIMLCTIECYRTRPIAADTSSSGFLQDLKAWSKISKNIFLWNYVVQFTNYVSPFPNFQVLQPNLQLFAKYGVKMVFEQANDHPASEFEALRSYIISKLLWNPWINVDSVMNDFLSGYYGQAGKYIKSYIDLMQAEILKSNLNLNIYGSPVDGIRNYLSPECMDKYNELFDEAEKSVENKPDLLERVKIARLPLIYAYLGQAKAFRYGSRGFILKNGNGTLTINPKIDSLLAIFNTYTKDINDVYLNEKGLTPSTYINRYKIMLSKSLENSLALFKPVKFLTKPNWKYPANGKKSLTDGIHGDEDYHFNWVGYEENNLEVVIDLQKVETVKKVSADFLQNSFSWIFLPKEFEVSLSVDGKNFKQEEIVNNTVPITKEETKSPENAFIKSFSCRFKPTKARYIKVKAVNMGICPRWHPGYPFKAWIFTDEIVVE